MHGNWLLAIPYALAILSLFVLIRAQRGHWPKQFSLRALLIATTIIAIMLAALTTINQLIL